MEIMKKLLSPFAAIKNSFMRAWRGEESLKSVLLKWGIIAISLLLLNFLLFLSVVIFFMYFDVAVSTIGLIMILNYLLAYASLSLVQKNVQSKNIFYNILINLVFIVIYLVLLRPISLAWDLFTVIFK